MKLRWAALPRPVCLCHRPLHALVRRLPLSLLVLSLLLLVLAASAAASPSSSSSYPPSQSTTAPLNPYEILGVSKKADQTTIRRHYKQQCLKYHPDKNVNRSETEQKRCEEAFKQIQRANELIGDEEARRRYDQMAAFGGRAHPSFGASSAPGPSRDDIFPRDYFRGGQYYYGARRRHRRAAFYVNGVDISDLFRSFPPANMPFFNNPSSAASSSWQGADNMSQSIYVEKVTIPLEDLYAGVDSKILHVHDSVWRRYRAAFRGGAAGRLALQAAISSIPLLLRTSLPVAALAFVLCFHIGLPRPERLIFPTEIRRGWKSGTKITYSHSPEIGLCDIVFVVQEGKHKDYVREGNNLRTSAAIGEREAGDGCTIHIEPLAGATELPIIITLRPGEVQGDGYVKTVKGKGWPGKRGRGDLKIDIRVVADDDEDLSERQTSTSTRPTRDAKGRRRKRRQQQRTSDG